ncbi:restriction endonuclease subunit S [Vibrio metschnikovii]|uniref:restriction endonuclease subunit S n=1 Tax=Vibrio metschnikovii TaxID=28172 RepID=UPI001C30D1F9|nr:restriction endonuclease subunit S [Vibrio metschnikovii]
MSWPLVNLESVAHINPRLPKGTDESQVVTFLKMASVSEGGELLEQEKRILSETKKGFTYFEKDDVLLAKITPCFENGKAALLDDLETQLGFGSTEFHVLRAVEGKLDSKYLFHLVWNEEFRFLGKHAMKGAAGQQRISTDFLKNLKIPLPPLETQKKIAAVLEKADQLRKDCKLLEQELNSLAQSVFIDMFGDVRSNSFNSKKVKFDDIFEINSKLVDPRLPEFENLPHIGPEHLEKRTGRILPYRTAREDALVSGKFNFQKGCVLFSKIRPNLKKVAIPEFSGLCSADMYPLEAVDGVSTREFIWGLILSDAFDDYLETLPSRANIPKINRKELAAFEFYLPDLRDQKAYSKKLAKIQEQLKQNACLYQETENNFNALMQKAFKGKLTL